MDRLLNSNQSVFSSDFEGQRDKVIIELLYSTGMRRQELVDLKWQQLDEASLQLKIIGKGNKERRMPVSPVLIEMLHEYKETVKNTFPEKNFDKHIVVSNNGEEPYPELIYRTVKKYLSLCSTQKKKSPHVLRHSFATHLSNNGAQLNDIKELLGHASLASTQVYTHTTIEQLKEVYKITHPKA
jgi:integrase/recombinase XerC